MNFWIEESNKEEPIYKIENTELAIEFLNEAKNKIFMESPPIDYWFLNLLYIDLLRVKQEPSILKTIKEQPNFELTELRAKVSILSSKELLDILPKKKDYGAAIIANRLIAIGQTSQMLDKMEFQSLSYDAQKEILSLISKYDKNISLVKKLYNLIKDSIPVNTETYGLNHIVNSQLENGEIDLKQALKLLDEFELSRQSYFSLATSCMKSGDMNMYKESLSYLADDSNRRWNITNSAGYVVLSLNNKQKQEFVEILKSEKQTKEIEMHLTLLTEILNEDFETNSIIKAFCDKHKKLQPEDIIVSFLIHSDKNKECIHFIDQIKGRNRFVHYERCLIKLLNQGDYNFVIDKIATINNNQTRSAIIERLLELDQYELARNLNNKHFNSGKLSEDFTDIYFLKYYFRKGRKEETIQLIERNKSSQKKVGYYHQLGRMSLGLKYGSLG